MIRGDVEMSGDARHAVVLLGMACWGSASIGLAR